MDQTTATILLVGLIAAPILWLIGRSWMGSKAQAFVDLGDIRGKPEEEIIAAVGPPTSISATPEGKLLQWMLVGEVGGYHYAILFDLEGKAIGYTHQYAQ
jgi:hypothetical protein